MELLSYLYTLFEESSRTGAPIVRPLWFEYPDFALAYEEAHAFLLGSNLLIAPNLEAAKDAYTVVFPPGTWIDRNTGERIPGGARVALKPSPNSSVREFVRAGTILVEQPKAEHSALLAQHPIELHVWPGPDCAGSVYTDDGNSFAHLGGAFRRLELSCDSNANEVTVKAKATGNYTPRFARTEVVFHGLEFTPTIATVKAATANTGERLASEYSKEQRIFRATLAGPLRDFELTVK
jgi:alpha-glucosidase